MYINCKIQSLYCISYKLCINMFLLIAKHTLFIAKHVAEVVILNFAKQAG